MFSRRTERPELLGCTTCTRRTRRPSSVTTVHVSSYYYMCPHAALLADEPEVVVSEALNACEGPYNVCVLRSLAIVCFQRPFKASSCLYFSSKSVSSQLDTRYSDYT